MAFKLKRYQWPTHSEEKERIRFKREESKVNEGGGSSLTPNRPQGRRWERNGRREKNIRNFPNDDINRRGKKWE